MCGKCGLVYVNPMPVAINTGSLYDAAYFDYYVMTAAINRRTYAGHLALIEKFALGKGRLLDVGCATGDFLGIAKSRGWEVSGVDISPAYADRIAKRLNVSITVGDFNKVHYSPESFDVVRMGDSIEHMLDPRGAVKKVFSILRPGGIGYVRTPDISHIMPRLVGKRWIQLKPFEHLYYFSRATMRRLLEEEGFYLLKMGSAGICCTLDMLRNRLEHYYNPRPLLKILDFFADTLRLGRARFYLDPLEEMQAVFQKPHHHDGLSVPEPMSCDYRKKTGC